MAKEYFPHDYNARNDKKMIALQMQYGIKGIGLYWCLIEMLYEESGYIMLSQCSSIAFELREDESTILSVLKDFRLFKFDTEKFWSESCLRRLEFITSKSRTASEAALRRWGKEKKKKSKKSSKSEFIPPTLEEVKKYFKENDYKESSAITAFNHYQTGDWIDKKGNAVKNWKQKMNQVWFKPEHKEAPKSKYGNLQF